jgi:hypothetical protein
LGYLPFMHGAMPINTHEGTHAFDSLFAGQFSAPVGKVARLEPSEGRWFAQGVGKGGQRIDDC